MKWHPIIENEELRAIAIERLEKIHSDIMDRLDSDIDSGIDLYQGRMGISIFLYYYSQIKRNYEMWKNLLLNA